MTATPSQPGGKWGQLAPSHETVGQVSVNSPRGVYLTQTAMLSDTSYIHVTIDGKVIIVSP